MWQTKKRVEQRDSHLPSFSPSDMAAREGLISDGLDSSFDPRTQSVKSVSLLSVCQTDRPLPPPFFSSHTLTHTSTTSVDSGSPPPQGTEKVRQHPCTLTNNVAFQPTTHPSNHHTHTHTHTHTHHPSPPPPLPEEGYITFHRMVHFL